MGLKAMHFDEQRITLVNPAAQAADLNRDAEFVDFDGWITNIYAEHHTAGITGAQITDLNKNGTTVFGADAVKITHATTEATATYGAVTDAARAVAAGDRLSIDVDSVHSGTAAELLMVHILVRKRYRALTHVAPENLAD